MKTENSSAAAFPIQHVANGLTKREYFAAMAMQALLSGADRHSQEDDCARWNYEYLSNVSLKAADELLKQLEETK